MSFAAPQNWQLEGRKKPFRGWTRSDEGSKFDLFLSDAVLISGGDESKGAPEVAQKCNMNQVEEFLVCRRHVGCRQGLEMFLLCFVHGRAHMMLF